MKTQKLTFSISGPSALKDNYTWQNADHRRCIVASLVRGVRVLESDRKCNRQGGAALALPWWESFNFELQQPLQDPKNNSYFGCIYKSKSWSPCDRYQPKYVIAFRGTIWKQLRDIGLDVLVIFSELHKCGRFNLAVEAVDNIINSEATSAGCVEAANTIWLAGHSLGASLALAVGKEMVKKNFYIDNTFLFNLPFNGLPLELIESKILRNGSRVIRWTGNFLGSIFIDPIDPIPVPDQRLLAWTPNIFVHTKDPICTEYIGYFRNRKTIMEKYGSSYFTHILTGHTIISLCSHVVGRKPEPSFQLGSARLIISQRRSYRNYFLDLKAHHKLEHWWTADLDISTELYQIAPNSFT